jgi:hypothetical protein
VIAKGVNAAIQQLQAFHKASLSVWGKRRQVLPLRHLPLADMRNRNWADRIPESMLNRELGVKVHLCRDAVVGGDIAMAGAAVFTHSHVMMKLICSLLMLNCMQTKLS